MRNSTDIDIHVRWVAKPPFFDRVARAPSSVTFWLQMDEHSAGGLNITDTPLTATSKDPWQRPLITYRLTSASTYLAIDPDTAVLSTLPGFASIDYNVIRWVNVTLEATDALGLKDYAFIRVEIQEINKPAVSSS